MLFWLRQYLAGTLPEPDPLRVHWRRWLILAVAFTVSAACGVTQFVYCAFINSAFFGASLRFIQLASVAVVVFSSVLACITWRSAMKLRRGIILYRLIE